MAKVPYYYNNKVLTPKQRKGIKNGMKKFMEYMYTNSANKKAMLSFQTKKERFNFLSKAIKKSDFRKHTEACKYALECLEPLVK